jgi:hypothetical protein
MKQVAVFLPDYIFAIAFDRVSEVKKDSQSRLTYAMPGVTSLLRSARGDVSRCQVSE